MSPSQYSVFRQTVKKLIVADRQVDLFEFFLFHHLIVHLDRCFRPQLQRQNVYSNVNSLKAEIAQLISVLACAGQITLDQQKTAFGTAIANLFPGNQPSDLFVPQWNHQQLSTALRKISQATPVIKKQILSAAVLVISHDQILTVQEVELFRATSESLDCPVPPLVATHR